MKKRSNQIRILTLRKGENLETTLFRLEKEWILRFVLGPSLHADNIRMFTNHPQSRSEVFKRQVFRELKWSSACNMKNDRHDSYIDIQMVIPGSFNYYFTIDGSDSFLNANGKGYFLVDPSLPVGDNEEIHMDGIQCQTVLSKSLGPFEEWKARLQVAKESGYNMIHFTPLQKLGVSNSSYSITDHKSLNPIFSKNKPVTYKDVEEFTRWMNKEWKILTANDLVFNHTSKCSAWLQQHPECAYNLDNSPHLKPAFLIDRIFHHFSLQVSRGEWKHFGVSPVIEKEEHMDAIRHLLHTQVFPQFRLHEFYLCDIEETIRKFRRRIKGNCEPVKNKDIVIIPDEKFVRMKGSIDFDVAVGYYNINRLEIGNSEEKLDDYCHMLREKLQQMNDQVGRDTGHHIDAAINNFLANVRYRFLAGDGPRVHRVTTDEPLMHDYFTMPSKMESSIQEEEKLMYTDNAKYIMACNGWVMNDNPLRNFAEPGNFIYFRRELIGWGDSIKLRYGKCPEDCPFLWQHMKEYTECTAKIADAIRLDNCHSTPLHVAEYMIDAARAIRPDLYVFAELFTSSEATDNLFMNHLGINSLIRESLAAWNAHELGRLVHRYGGQPVGAFVQPHVQPLTATMAHAIFFDQTHDNESPIVKRSVYDSLPSTALVAMSCCASGSNRGYDELVPHHIHVVNENRMYMPWTSKDSSPTECTMTSGILRGKKILNDLHSYLGKSGFNQVYVDQLDSDVVSVTRHSPSTHQSIVLIARTSFSFPHDPNNDGTYIKTVNLPGIIEDVLFEMKMVHKDSSEYRRHQEHINGLPNYQMQITEKIKAEQSKMIFVSHVDDNGTQINFKNFTPSSVIAFRLSLPIQSKDAILKVRSHLNQFGYVMRSYSGRSLFDKDSEASNFREIVSEMDFSAYNRAMFRVTSEDESDGKGFRSYDIPNFGSLTYCGLQGICDLLNRIRSNNDLGHPVCNNLRDGDWLPGYIADRLKAHANTRDLGQWFESVFRCLRKVPRYLIPCYFDAIVSGAFMIMKDNSIDMMSEFIVEGSSFVQALALGSIQFCGFVKHAELPPLADDIHEPRPKTLYTDEKGRKHLDVLSLAAGLPHFASGFARNWGRDTFIAIRGDLLLTGRFNDARYLILAYGGCLRHGLIPNLLLEGEGARYNCRDAFWWWIQCIQDYCKLAPDGHKILDDKVARIYPDDHCAAKITNPVIMPLKTVMQEGMEKHARGVSFRERNAGPQIDYHMSDEGFNVNFGVDWKTGFVYGGNKHNCGTWMDMMGSSEKAGTRGKPSTPRDGSAVEIIGLCKSTVTWLDKLYQEKLYPYQGVEIKNDAAPGNTNKIITYKNWAEKIQNNFEKLFWIKRDPSTQDPDYKLINRRGIYKDSYNASETWRDYQLRPNFPMAMVVAPELFTPENAWHALKVAGSVLQGPLGMKTLDPTDWNYCGFYDNNNDSNDPKVAKGFNYHQGPEWVWPIGFFFRAKLYFARLIEKSQPGTLQTCVNEVKTDLTRHYQHIVNSPWKSLPELTNENGAYCHPSCQAQAWSVSTILETLHDMEYIV